MEYTNFLDLLRYLKNNLLLPFPIQVRRVRLCKGIDGDCQLKNEKFIIRINRNLNENQAIDTLLHEIGHCLAWDEDNDEFHGPNWGAAYSVVYREFLKWNDCSVNQL